MAGKAPLEVPHDFLGRSMRCLVRTHAHGVFDRVCGGLPLGHLRCLGTQADQHTHIARPRLANDLQAALTPGRLVAARHLSVVRHVGIRLIIHRIRWRGAGAGRVPKRCHLQITVHSKRCVTVRNLEI